MNSIAKITAPLTCAVLMAISPSIVSAQAENSSMQMSKPILGMIVPNKTTLKEFEKALEAKGCQYKAQTVEGEYRSHIVIEQGCFDLPGDPFMEANATDEEKPIHELALQFPTALNDRLYGRYETALEKSYGEPSAEYEANGTRTTVWAKLEKELVVFLISSEKGEEHFLAYVIGPTAKDAWESFKTTMPLKKGMDLENL